MSTASLLVVEHQATCPAGWVGEWLDAAQVRQHVVRPYAGDGLPENLTGHDGLLVLGGSMGAYDEAEFPWLGPVKELIREAAGTGTPALGICLGHQLCAAALGGRVAVNPRGQAVGLYDVGWCVGSETDPLLGRLPRPTTAVQWNDDIVTEIPAEAEVLAYTAHEEVQAARFAPTVWGVQWHPEAGADIVRAWADKDRDRVRERGIDVDERVAEIARATDELRATWSVLTQSFADVVGLGVRAAR
jgi:GMP synthase (glutamine-hydrolysing)